MNKIKILKYPNPFLKMPTILVSDPSSKLIRILLKKLFTTLSEQKIKGYGLTANQIGNSSRVFVTQINGIRKHYINPVFDGMSGEMITREGCYSMNRKLKYRIKRYKELNLEYYTHDGIKRYDTFEGMQAMIIQHEMDHLDGILIYDRWMEQKP